MMKTALVAVAAALAAFAQSAPSDPQAILASTREALGGEKKLTAVKTIVATGRTQQVRGNNLVPIEFEINIELPDKYVRKDEIPAQESGPSTAGFTYVGQGEAPQGTADVLEAKGAPNFTMRLFILRSTHLPIMISWQGAAPSGRGGPPARGAAAAPPAAAAPAGPPPENRIYFAEYRDVDGLKWPFRLRRALGADTVEETTFDRFRINAKIDPKKFQP
jgi:hypothetical protein